MQYFTFWFVQIFFISCDLNNNLGPFMYYFNRISFFSPPPLLPPPCHPNYALKITSNYHFYPYLLSLWNEVIYGWVLSCAQKGGPYFSFCSHIVLGNTILWWNYIQHVFIVIFSSEEILTRFAFTIYRHKSFSYRFNGGHLQMTSVFYLFRSTYLPMSIFNEA